MRCRRPRPVTAPDGSRSRSRLRQVVLSGSRGIAACRSSAWWRGTRYGIPLGCRPGSAGRRSGISFAANDIASSGVSSPTVNAGAICTPVLGSSASSRNTRRECSVQARRRVGAFGGAWGRPHRARHHRGRLLWQCGRPYPHRPARFGQTQGRRQAADTGTDHDNLLCPGHGATLAKKDRPRLWLVTGIRSGLSGMGGRLAIRAPSSPLRMPRRALQLRSSGIGRRGGVGILLPGLAAVRLERFVGRLDLNDLRLFAQGVVQEVAVGVAQSASSSRCRCRPAPPSCRYRGRCRSPPRRCRRCRWWSSACGVRRRVTVTGVRRVGRRCRCR